MLVSLPDKSVQSFKGGFFTFTPLETTMTTITIEMDETGAGTMSLDGAEPVPFENAEEVCSVIEQMAGQSDADEQTVPDEEGAMNGYNKAPRPTPMNSVNKLFGE